MPHTTLPAAHSEADAVLAQQVGQKLQLRELHVFWTLPVDGAQGQRPPSLSLTSAFAAIGSLLERIGERLAQVHGVRQDPYPPAAPRLDAVDAPLGRVEVELRGVARRRHRDAVAQEPHLGGAGQAYLEPRPLAQLTAH